MDRPKPMVDIGGKPILWHIMKSYSSHGINDFVICCGYKGYMIKEYFCNYFYHQSDITVDLEKNQISVHRKTEESWRVTLVDTGENSMTGGRLKRVSDSLKNEDAFCFTYGDGLSNVDISALIKSHEASDRLATVTAVQPMGRYGALEIEGSNVTGFREKPPGDGSWINGGFFVLSPKVLDYIEGDQTSWEDQPLTKLAEEGQLNSYFHKGFWQPMDTLRDLHLLEDLWQQKRAPWKSWS
jgi:glucose-1-phosphate cytidylyltransferase